MKTPRISVLVSGTGSLLEAMIDDALPIDLVIADRPCRGIDIAAEAGIPIELIPRYSGTMTDKERDTYTIKVCGSLIRHRIGLVAMAGFMTIFSARMFDHYGGRLLNIHPSLLPDFKGHHAVRDALVAGVKETGSTVHVATEDLDAGPVLAQARVPVLEGDTEATLHERIKVVERVLYPQTIREYSSRLVFQS